MDHKYYVYRQDILRGPESARDQYGLRSEGFAGVASSIDDLASQLAARSVPVLTVENLPTPVQVVLVRNGNSPPYVAVCHPLTGIEFDSLVTKLADLANAQESQAHHSS